LGEAHAGGQQALVLGLDVVDDEGSHDLPVNAGTGAYFHPPPYSTTSRTRNPAMRRIKSSGSGASSGNWMVLPDVAEPPSSAAKCATAPTAGCKLTCRLWTE